ncbi:hypothetical protein niasHT_016855 [Heterodera trifolii]|uniref:Mediator of RNA polymerase II transcription subunit 14 n=1 Tax=Heterodera trifolii TaxID=157864 RepID=A0ABD2KTH0_9BILA
MPAPLAVEQQMISEDGSDANISQQHFSANGTPQQPPSAAVPPAAAAAHLLKNSLSAPLLANLPPVPPQCGPPTVSLALLIDFAIHWNYRQFEILSELNSKKKETDRKISVVEFAHNTRLIFVRLLAIVRWLKSAKKFEPLASIRHLLDEQATRYVETADRLVEIARNELPNARLPAFQVAQAVDVLTLGSYPRLPQNIKDRFIPPLPLGAAERRLTLRQLNKLIEFHLAQQAAQLSPRIRHITIRNGMACLVVPGEFEMELTRLGDEPTTRWTLLNIRILVESAEVGEGQQMVHPLQINFLHQMVQEKLDTANEPIMAAYIVLHWFCRSLHLDILFCQALQIAKINRSGKGSEGSSQQYIRVDEYNEKECRLAISYWLRREGGTIHGRLSSHYRMLIFGDKNNSHVGLKIRHHPSSTELPTIDHEQSPSLQRLLNETVLFRCRERLLAVQQLLEAAFRTLSSQPNTKCPSPASPSSTNSEDTSQQFVHQSGHSLLTLSCPLVLIGDCHPDECLTVAVNTFSGAVIARVEVLGQREEIHKLEHQLNTCPTVLLHSSGSSLSAFSVNAIGRLLARLRVLVIGERLNRALVGMQVNSLNEAQALPLMAKLNSLPPERRIFQFIRDDQFYLVVTFAPDDQTGVRINFHLFSASENRLTLLDLDAEHIIRTAPAPSLRPQKSESFQNFYKRNKKQSEGRPPLTVSFSRHFFMDSENALQSFKEFTGCTDDHSARRLLSKCAWNLERAIDFFFSGRREEEEEGDGEVMWDEQQPMTSQGTRRRISHFANSPWTTPAIGGNAANGNRRTDETSHNQFRTARMDDDSVQTLDDSDVQMVEETDRKAAPPPKAVNGSAASASSDGVRAPIAPVQGVLIEQSFRETYQNQNRERLWNPVFEQYRQDHQQPSSSSAAASFVSRRANGANNRIDLGEQFAVRPSARAPLAPLSVVPLNQNDADENDGRPTHSHHRKTLQTLFRPPVELMFQGDWDQALQAARQKSVWLLVNVQEASEFACAVLNRDIWSAETVREVVRSNFLFWQVYHDSADGARIRNYYGLSSFPAIFIVDPRTGEEVSGRLKASDSVSFLDSLTSFLDQNPTFEARDRFIREQTSSTLPSEFVRTTSPPSPKNRTETPTKKRKMPVDDEEKDTGTERKGQQVKTKKEEEEERMMNIQAKKIKRVMTISDHEDFSTRHPFASSQFAASNEQLFDSNEWRHWLLNGDGQSKGKPTIINGKVSPPRIAQMLLRLPDGRTERVRMWMAAPLSALFSLLSSLGFAPAAHQLVLDYPRREYTLSPQNRRLSLESVGFGVQEVVHVDRIAP